AIQYFFAPIQLDPTHYYVKALPVVLSLENWLIINLMSIIICMAILIIPSLLIQKVEPVKALRYE
ncbi:MAG: ABC transporter permease, partial [Flavobacteriales bacterium]|nr:ABC transporter permease [Flavobacteriales bacterium]